MLTPVHALWICGGRKVNCIHYNNCIALMEYVKISTPFMLQYIKMCKLRTVQLLPNAHLSSLFCSFGSM
jgi:hypothetical protein